MHPFDIPNLTLGPGSQPAEDDGAELDCLPLPKMMQTYQPPRLPEADELGECAAGLRLLERLLEQLQDYSVLDSVLEPASGLDLLSLPEPDRLLVGQALGEGEVSILFATDTPRIQETRLAGVWRVQSHDASGQLTRDAIEVADIPRDVREMAFQGASAHIMTDPQPPADLLTARSILAELNAQVAPWRPGDPPHAVNLTLLPHSASDLAYLEQQLGPGSLTILSRGYGNCRITATALKHCWWVQHFNSDDRLILNSIEIVDIPAAALAAQEDIEDSATRLVEILQALR